MTHAVLCPNKRYQDPSCMSGVTVQEQMLEYDPCSAMACSIMEQEQCERGLEVMHCVCHHLVQVITENMNFKLLTAISSFVMI
jgi:hypothetical protein